MAEAWRLAVDRHPRASNDPYTAGRTIKTARRPMYDVDIAGASKVLRKDLYSKNAVNQLYEFDDLEEEGGGV